MKRLMILTVLTMMLVALGVASAAEKGTTQLFFGYSALTNEGMPALSSMRVGYFNLGYSPYVGNIGFRYFLNDLWAIRGGLSFGSIGADVKIENDLGKGDGTDSQYGFSFIFERYFAPVASVSPYFGFGFAYQYGKITYEGIDIIMMSDEEVCAEWKASEFHIPVSGGFQWAASDRFAFGGEVVMDYITYSIDEVFEGMPKVEYSGNTFGFYGATVFLSMGF